MESVLHKIRSLYGEMGPAERKIADCILKNPDNIISASVSELASLSGCGDATVVRFSRRLGFSGYQGLKIGIAGELSSASVLSGQISKDDSCYDIFLKRINDVAVALNNTKTALDAGEIEKAATAVKNATRIVIFGLGNSQSVAIDAQHKFLRLGLNATACCDNHMQAIISAHLDEKSVAIGVSHSGSSRDTVEALKAARGCGATTICVTNYGASPITSQSDICLFTKSEETRHTILAMSSRIAQLTIFDAIYTYIVAHGEGKTVQAIHDTEMALRDKKY